MTEPGSAGGNAPLKPHFRTKVLKPPRAVVPSHERIVTHPPIDVVAGVISFEGRFLITQRLADDTLGGYWEFPGGKVEPGERPEDALIRELHEELGITVKALCLAPLTFASHAYDDFHLLMPLYVCRRWAGFVIAKEGQALKWVTAKTLRDYPMPPADAPLIPHLIELLG